MSGAVTVATIGAPQEAPESRSSGSASQHPDLLSDRDTAEATYEVVRALAAGILFIFAGFTVYHSTADPGPAAGLVLAADQVVLLASSTAFWLMAKRKVPIAWAHMVAVSLGLVVAADTTASAIVQRDGADLQYMQAIVIGAGAIALSSRAFAVMLLGTAALAIPAAVAVCSQDQLIRIAVMQAAASLLSVALYRARLHSQKKLLLLRQRAAQTAADLGRALERAEYEFAEHERSEAQRRELEERLRQAQKLEALGTLAGGVAHDMNNVLGAITATVSVALEERAVGSADRQELVEVLEAARRGEALTRNILSFARRGSMQTAPFQVDAVVGEVESLLQRTLPKRIELSSNYGAAACWVEGDAGQIGHLLTNLCLNSADAIEGHGQIRISTRSVELVGDQADKLGAKPGSYVELLVADDGRGIANDVLPRVFEPYFSTKSDQQHSGLGLSMVYGTVQQHRGGIDIRSDVGRGTTVTVVLPTLPGAPEQPPSRGCSQLRHDPARNHLLVVDDEPMLRRAGQRIASSLGFQVLLAGDGQEALEQFSAHRPAVAAIVLDMAMPVMSGAECCRQLRQWDARLPIVLVSGFPKDHDLLSLLDAHTRYVRKPYARDDLADALVELLGEQPLSRT